MTVHKTVGYLGKVVFSSVHDVFLIDVDAVVAIWAGLFVVEADGVADFVGDCAQLQERKMRKVIAMQDCLSKLITISYMRALQY